MLESFINFLLFSSSTEALSSFPLPDVYVTERYVARIKVHDYTWYPCAHGGFYMAFLKHVKKYGIRFALWLFRRTGALRWMRRTDREWKDLL